MTPTTLRFRARGTALVQHFEQLDRGVKQFVGRKIVETSPGRFSFSPTEADEEVPYRAEYVKACAEGALYPADAPTAQACAVYARAHGLPPVTFDPLFGEPPKVAPQPASATPERKV